MWLHAKGGRRLRGMASTFHMNSVIVYNDAHLGWSHAQGYPMLRVLTDVVNCFLCTHRKKEKTFIHCTHCQNYLTTSCLEIM